MIAERLRDLRHEKGISKRELITALPINYSTYANYESGFREPNSEILQMLARYFNVSMDYLMGMTDNRKKADEIAVLTDTEHEHIMRYRALDEHGKDLVDTLLNKEYEHLHYVQSQAQPERKLSADMPQWVNLQVFKQRASAGLGNYLSDDSDQDFEWMRFLATPISLKSDFCVQVKGDSMEPKICNGDIVFVKAMPRVDPDSIGIFTYEGEAYCKRLRVDHKKGLVYLESLNKAYAPKRIDQPENLWTVGLVIGVV